MFKKKTKEPKIKIGKKHVNKIEISLVYDKDSLVPSEVNIHKDCTIVDLFVAISRLNDIVHDEAKTGDRDITTFLVNCFKAYIEKASEQN